MLGFDTSDATMTDLQSSAAAQDAIKEHGFPMTVDERAEFEERQRIGNETDSVNRFAHSLSGFAGSYQIHAGRLFVYRFSTISPDEVESLRSQFPAPERLVIDRQARFSLDELRSQQEQSMADLSARLDRTTDFGIGLDIRGNGLLVNVESQEDERIFRASYGGTAPYRVVVGSGDDACSGPRTTCNDPQRAGVGITGAGGGPCSTGYAVRTTTGNEMLLTAGHCWLGNTTGDLFSGGFLGNLTHQNTLNYFNPEADARLIETVNTSTYNWLYVSSTNKQRVVGQKKGYYATDTGTQVCVFGHPWDNTNLSIPQCGTIDYVEYDYYHSGCGCYMTNMMLASYDHTGGLSGGAVGSSNGYTAVGIHSGWNGNWARFGHIEKVEDWLNVTLSTSS